MSAVGFGTPEDMLIRDEWFFIDFKPRVFGVILSDEIMSIKVATSRLIMGVSSFIGGTPEDTSL